MSRLRKPKAGFWIRLSVSVISPLDAVLFRLRWHGLDRVPAPGDGGVIIAINHISHIDTMLMARLVWQAGRIPRFMVKATLFGKPVLGTILRGTGQIAVYRSTDNAAASLGAAAAALRRGEAVVIYPEGTITRDPAQWPMLARTGIARLVLMCPHVPVVPVGQWGAQQRNGAPGRTVLRRRTSLAHVAAPLDLGRFHDAEPNAAMLREITDTIMNAIRDEVARLRGERAPDTCFVPVRKYVDTG